MGVVRITIPSPISKTLNPNKVDALFALKLYILRSPHSVPCAFCYTIVEAAFCHSTVRNRSFSIRVYSCIPILLSIWRWVRKPKVNWAIMGGSQRPNLTEVLEQCYSGKGWDNLIPWACANAEIITRREPRCLISSSRNIILLIVRHQPSHR